MARPIITTGQPIGRAGPWLRAELLGIKQALAVTKTLKSNWQNMGQKLSMLVATAILEQATTYCPVESGLLRESGRIVQYGQYPDVVAEVIFGSEYAYYAVYVHEIPAIHKPPTRYKFLEQATKDVAPRIQQLVVRFLARPDVEQVRVGPVELELVGTVHKNRGREGVLVGHAGGVGRIHQLALRGHRLQSQQIPGQTVQRLRVKDQEREP